MICAQLLKIAKFTSLLVPKMGLAPLVLKRALPDLVFFCVTFAVSILAFSNFFYLQMGAVMEDYNDPYVSLMSLFRALFGDFDIDLIMENSTGYFNAGLFLTYLFTAIFILLSMFFAILGEAQAIVREDERKLRSGPQSAEQPEYGIFVHIYQFVTTLAARLPVIGPRVKQYLFVKQADAVVEVLNQGPTAVDRIEARQLESVENQHEMYNSIKQIESITLANKLDRSDNQREMYNSIKQIEEITLANKLDRSQNQREMHNAIMRIEETLQTNAFGGVDGAAPKGSTSSPPAALSSSFKQGSATKCEAKICLAANGSSTNTSSSSANGSFTKGAAKHDDVTRLLLEEMAAIRAQLTLLAETRPLGRRKQVVRSQTGTQSGSAERAPRPRSRLARDASSSSVGLNAGNTDADAQSVCTEQENAAAEERREMMEA